MSRTPLLQVDAVWLAVELVKMHRGADRLFTRVMQVFGAALLTLTRAQFDALVLGLPWPVART